MPRAWDVLALTPGLGVLVTAFVDRNYPSLEVTFFTLTILVLLGLSYVGISTMLASLNDLASYHSLEQVRPLHWKHVLEVASATLRLGAAPFAWVSLALFFLLLQAPDNVVLSRALVGGVAVCGVIALVGSVAYAILLLQRAQRQ